MFITLEGMEGAGKTTLANALKARFEAMGHEVLLTREPGGCDFGQMLRPLLLDMRSSLTAETELFLFLADRAQHAADVIRPALDRGAVVISDRYADSTIVYQGYGRGMDIALLYRLNDMAVRGLWPEKTLVLDLPPSAGLARARGRNAREGTTEAEGRFEAEVMDFHVRVRNGFLDWAAQQTSRCVVLDATADPDTLLGHAWAGLRGLTG